MISQHILSLINRLSRKIIGKNIGDLSGTVKLDLVFMSRTLHSTYWNYTFFSRTNEFFLMTSAYILKQASANFK